MNFSTTIILGFHILLCQRVSSSLHSILQDETLSIEKDDSTALGKFFTELSKVYLKKNNFRQITIIGASNDELREAQPLIANYPYSICTNPETCVHPRGFNSRSFFVVFLDDLGDKTFEKNLKILSMGTNECEFLFIYEGVIIDSNDQISSFFLRAVKRNMAHFAFAHLAQGTIRVYRPFVKENCSRGAELIWEPGTDMNKINILSLRIRDMKRCPIRVSSFQYMPKMVIKQGKNGSLTIVGGRDGMMVLLIAEKLNFIIDLKHPATNQSQKTAILKEVTSGIVAFGVGRIRPTNESAISLAFDEECITWTVPRILSGTGNLLWMEFSWLTWVLIGLVLVISCAIGYIHHSIILSANANRRGARIGRIILQVVSMNLGNPATRRPVSIAGKIMMIGYLYYALVMTTAYKASLDSIMTTFKSSSAITDQRGIVDADLDVGGSQYHYEVLMDQSEAGEVTSELIKRYVVYANDSKAANRAKIDRRFAFLARRSTLNYEKQMTVKSGKILSFNILDECVLTFAAVLAFPKGSYLLSPVNKIISRIRESGILNYWDSVGHENDKELEMKNADAFSAVFRGKKFKTIFLFYFCCIFVCLVVFFIEILLARFKPKKRQGIAQRNYQTN